MGHKESNQTNETLESLLVNLVSMVRHRFRLAKIMSVKLYIFSYPSVLAYVLDAQKKRLIETVLLSTHNICFG